MKREVPYGDLLGVKYVRGSSDPDVGLDCLGTVLVMHARLGIQSPPVLGDGGEDVLLEWVRDREGPWDHLGRDLAKATALGDVVLTESQDALAGCAVLVCRRPPIFLTASSGAGRVYAAKPKTLGGVLAVYRWRGYGG